MELSEFTIRLIIIFVPGVISTLIVGKITSHPKWSKFDFLTYTIVLGILSYLLHQIGIYIWAIKDLFINKTYIPQTIRIWDAIFNKITPIPPGEVMITYVYSVIIGFCVSGLIQKKILYKITKNLEYPTSMEKKSFLCFS